MDTEIKKKLKEKFNKGLNDFNNSNFNSALTNFKYILKLKPNETNILNLISISYYNLKKYTLAEKFINEAIKNNSNEVGFLINKGNILADQNKFLAAENVLEGGISRFDKSEELFYNLGVIKSKQKKFNEAIIFYNKSLKINPSQKFALNNLGSAQKEVGEYNKAISYYRNAILVDKNFYEAYFNLGLIELLIDKNKNAWNYFEYREVQNNHRKNNLRKLNIKKWNGSSLKNKKIIIYIEQGIGDSIQFIRYIKNIEKKNTKIYLYTKEYLKFLFQAIDEVDRIILDTEDLPKSDFYISLMSLPFIFKKNKQIPKPYNFFPKNKKLDLYWNNKINKSKPNIGLAWQGDKINNKNDYKRSISISLLEPIINLKKLNFISLQKNFDINEVELLHKDKNIVNFFDNIDKRPFEDTISIIKNLDIIITVDTAIAHVAATLGKETLILLPFVPDFRWGLNSENTKWYKSVKLFRRKKTDSWKDVILKIKKYLKTKYRIQ